MVKRGLLVVLSSVILLLLCSVAYSAIVDDTIEKELEKNTYVKVIVKLKDDPQVSKLKPKEGKISASQKKNFLEQKRQMITEKQEKVLSELGIDENGEGKKEKIAIKTEKIKSKFILGRKYSTINGFSGKVTKEGLELLKNNPDVEAIQFDYPMAISLDVSVPLINATQTWGLQLNGINITGAGETICIVDTGIDYTHPNLSGCNITRFNFTGNIENLTTPIESPHNYTDNTRYNWTIYKPGYTNIAVHFRNMSIEPYYDELKIYDKNWSIIGIYSGSHNDMWSAHGQGDTLYIVWETDSSINDYGIYIDQTLNGTTNMTYSWSNCTKVLGGWDIRNSDGDPYDDHGHGTHCAGIAASESAIYRGVAPGAKLISIKIFSSGGTGTDSDVAAGIDWCINKSEEYNISVISMSLGCDGAGCTHWQSYCDDDEEAYYSAEPINTANNLGIAVVVAAGNSGWTNGISSPACVSGAIPVGAVNDADSITYNRGNLLDLLAPGVGIISTVPGGGMGSKSGTSMSTPHVAGAVALLKQFMKLWNNTEITPQQIKEVLNRTGKIIDDTANSGKNYSRIRIYDAILSLDNLAPNITFVSPTPDDESSANGQIVINVSVSDTLTTGFCILEWNYTNESMTKIGSEKNFSCYSNKTLNVSGIFYYKVYANDSSGNIADTSLRMLVSNTPPNITSFYPNTSIVNIAKPNNQTFNISYIDADGDSLDVLWVLNGSVVQEGGNYTFIGNYSTAGDYNITVFVFDWTSVAYKNWILKVNNTNRALTWVQTPQNKTSPEDTALSFTLNATDLDDDTIYYYINNSNFTINNLTGAINYTPPADWNGIIWLTVNATDGYANIYSIIYINITPVNDAPVIYNIIGNTTINEGSLLNITVNASDVDGDALTYAINDNRFTQSSNSFWWQTNYQSSGSFTVRLNVTDGILANYKDVSVTIIDTEDNDNDGINNSVDYLIGNVSSITSSTPLTLIINGSTNTSKLFNGTLLINITNGTTNMVEFNWNFNSTNVLNLSNVTIQKQSSNTAGSLFVKGIVLASQNLTKTFYVDNLIENQTTVCIEDKEITAITDISTGCNGANETLVVCNSTLQSGFNCTDLGSQYKITGLRYSGVKEQCADSDGDRYGTGCLLGTDCNDNNANINPGHSEVCGNNIDDNCNGNTDEGCSADGSTSGGGGGGGGGGAKTYILDLSETEITQLLEVGSRIRFVYNSEYHYVKLNSIGADFAHITVSSLPIDSIIILYETKKFDLDDDNYYDISVRLDSITSSNATFAFKIVKEEYLSEYVISENGAATKITEEAPSPSAAPPEETSANKTDSGAGIVSSASVIKLPKIIAENMSYILIAVVILVTGALIYMRKEEFFQKKPSEKPSAKEEKHEIREEKHIHIPIEPYMKDKDIVLFDKK